MNQDTIDQLVEVHYRAIIEAEADAPHADTAHKFYFDAYDVLRTISGINEYYSSGKFNNPKYSSIDTTLYSLLLDKWISEIQLLPTHQAELLDFVRRANPSETLSPSNIEAFVVDVLHHRNVQVDQGDSAANLLQQRVLNSQDQYNLCQTIMHGDWRRRLRRLHEGPLRITQYDMREVASLPDKAPDIFYPLLKSLHKLRSQGEYSMSNFRDAVSLTYLHASKSADPSRIPILLDSRGGLFSLAIKAANLKSEFEYHNQQLGREVSLIRGTEYFILKALFDTPKQKVELLKRRYADIYAAESEQRDVYSWKVHLERQHLDVPAATTLITSVGHKIKTYRKYFDEYLRHRFFQRIGLTAELDQLTTDVVAKHLSGTPLGLENKEVADYIRAFKRTYLHAAGDSDKFDVLSKVWHSLMNHSRPQWWQMRSRLSEVDEDFIQVHFGLLRFGLSGMIVSETAQSRYAQCLDAIFHDQQDRHKREEVITAQVVLNLTDALFKNDSESLAIAISALWILDKYSMVADIIDRFNVDQVPNKIGMRLIQAASLILFSHMEDKVSRVVNILDELNSKDIDLTDVEHLGCAYVNYLVWDMSDSRTFSKMLNHPTEYTNNYYSSARLHIERCLSLLGNKVAEWEKTRSLASLKEYNTLVRLKLYALNVKLFLIVEGEPGEKDFMKAQRVVTELIALKPSQNVAWQARYDDTVARYKLRKSLYAFAKGDMKEFKSLMNGADKDAKKAKKDAFQDVSRKASLCDNIATLKKMKHDELTEHLAGKR